MSLDAGTDRRPAFARWRERLDRYATSWMLPASIIALGLVERLLWLVMRGRIDNAGGEAANVAVAFARTGVLADAFRVGQGPTAHIAPISPTIAGSVYALFGVKSFTSELLLLVWSLGLTIAGSLFFYRAFGLAGVSRTARLAGLALFWLLPVNFHSEVVNFRIWEGALASALAGGLLWAALHADARAQIGWTWVALLSLLAALLFFINPALGLGGYAVSLLLMVRRFPPSRWLGVGAAATAALLLVVTPWAVRNQLVMGEFVPLRSNFGLELALANHPAAAQGGDDASIFLERLERIHPWESDAAFARMKQAGGEVAYAKQLGAEAQAWIKANPADFALLSAKHLGQFFFPPAWFWTIYDKSSQATELKQGIAWGLSLLGLAGVLLALIQRNPRFHYLVLMTLTPCLLYVIVQPVPRYRYIVFAPLVFFACHLIGEVIGRARSGFAPGGQRPEPGSA